mgnify:CR=1 FL=1
MKATNATFIIRNKASTIGNVNIQWTSSFASSLGKSSNFYLSEIGANSQVELPVTISIYPGTQTGINTMTISMTYNDQTGTTKTSTFNVGVVVRSDIKLLTSLESQDVLVPGSKGTASVKISNAGDDIKFLVIKTSSDSFDVNPKTIYVGNLKSDDYDTEKLTIASVKSLAPGTYNLIVGVEYQDIFGKSYTEESVLPIQISSSDSIQKADYTLPIVVFFIIVLIVAIVLYRRRKN